MSEERDWLIWSYEHAAFWQPRECGYTRDVSGAGLYAEAHARMIVENANIPGRNEVMVHRSALAAAILSWMQVQEDIRPLLRQIAELERTFREAERVNPVTLRSITMLARGMLSRLQRIVF